MTQEIAAQKQGVVVVDNSPAAIIQRAIEGGADLEKLSQLLQLQERWESNEARKAYYKAMAAFKSEAPQIDKDKQVKFDGAKGQVSYNHATLANVSNKIREVMSRHGLFASWHVSQNGVISVTCKITHEQGYGEETTLTAPADSSGTKNSIQAIGSTITYLERYTLLALTGLATQDIEDDDGKAACPDTISEAEAHGLVDSLLEAGVNMDRFLAYMKADKIENIKKTDLTKALAAIESAKKNLAKAVPK